MRSLDADPGFLADLRNHGVSFEELSPKVTWQHQQRWRECYCAPIYEKTGKWRIGRWDWNTFMEGYARCVLGEKAWRQFLACPVNHFLVIPEAGSGLRCSAAAMLELSTWPQESYIFPTDLEWTMVLSHEVPFFSRKEWLIQNVSDME